QKVELQENNRFEKEIKTLRSELERILVQENIKDEFEAKPEDNTEAMPSITTNLTIEAIISRCPDLSMTEIIAIMKKYDDWLKLFHTAWGNLLSMSSKYQKQSNKSRKE